MKRLFLGSVALVALSLGTPAAMAAELARPRPAPPPPPVPVYTWTGCYVGPSAGNSSGTSQHFTTAGSIVTGPGGGPVAGGPITDRFNLSGFIGGGQIGCNWQWGVLVFGVEADGSATNKEGQAFETPLEPFLPGSSNFVSQTQERWLVTARGKLGWTILDKTMVYGTGGGAWAKIDTSEFLAGRAFGTGHQESNTRSGWTVGGGLEYALGYGWSAKGEFLYVKFDNFTTFTTGPFGVGNIAPREVKLEDYI